MFKLGDLQEKSKVQAWLELMISLKIIFELELVGKLKSLKLAWVKLELKLLSLRFKKLHYQMLKSLKLRKEKGK